jgi:hypothetical protein
MEKFKVTVRRHVQRCGGASIHSHAERSERIVGKQEVIWIFVLAQIAGWISVSPLRTRGVCCAPDRWQNELARLRACPR